MSPGFTSPTSRLPRLSKSASRPASKIRSASARNRTVFIPTAVTVAWANAHYTDHRSADSAGSLRALPADAPGRVARMAGGLPVVFLRTGVPLFAHDIAAANKPRSSQPSCASEFQLHRKASRRKPAVGRETGPRCMDDPSRLSGATASRAFCESMCGGSGS